MSKTPTMFLILLLVLTSAVYGQDHMSVSLYLKKDRGVQLDSISSKSGNLFHKLGHHGPAVENPWLGFRIYFDKRSSIDVYSKASPGPELKEFLWYPSRKQQMEGYGADYYKVGKTLGLGGIRLWDGEELVPLHPVSRRTARVFQGRDSSWMEMYSKGIQFQGKEVDILIRLTVYPKRRPAKVEAFSQSGEKLHFATGINYFDNFNTKKTDSYIATWGQHPEDVAASPTEVGAALIYQKNSFERQMDDGKQFLLISKPCKEICIWITSANAREKEINNFGSFIQYLENLSIL